MIMQSNNGKKGNKMENKNYHDQQNITNLIKLREIIPALPGFCKQFFRGIENNTSSRTRLGYALDLRIFFEFLKETNSSLKNTEITKFPLSLLDSLTIV